MTEIIKLYFLSGSNKDDVSGRSCQLCGRTFTKKCDLKRHVNQVHLKLRPYKCNQCDASFPRRPQLKIHVRKAHDNSQDEAGVEVDAID